MRMSAELKQTIDRLCLHLESMRALPFLNDMRGHIEDQIIMNLMAEHAQGNETAGLQLVAHAQMMIDRVYHAGFRYEDSLFLAEVTLDEAIAFERVHMIARNQR